jgi:hypothetical protein
VGADLWAHYPPPSDFHTPHYYDTYALYVPLALSLLELEVRRP